MAINQKANVDVTLNNEQAKKELEELQTSMKKLADLRDQAFKSGDTGAFKAYDSELKKATRTAASYKKELFDVDKVIRNMSGSSLNDLKKAQAAITAEIGKMDRTTAQYAKRSQDLKKVKEEITAIGNETKATQSRFSRFTDGFNKYFGVATAWAAGIAGISMTVKGAIQSFNDFEERVAALSSLTGLAGDDLEYLSDQAKELATSTLDGGVLVTNGSQDIIDAFTKVGSARPELLKNKEALVEVTKNAMILSSASKEELGPSISALTMVMNQYNTSADQARRIINVLAAGSKEGAGEIPYITTAFEKAGTVASDAGISIESLTATIETLAPRISSAEVAGTQLRGVILRMQKGADDTNPAIVGMSTALDNLSKKNLSTKDMIKLFGMENLATAKILVNNVQELKNYENAVKDTNTALEQGKVNTETNNARMAQAKERFAQVARELGEKLSPAYGSIISKSSLMLKSIVAIVDILIKYGRNITVAAVAIGAYKVALIAAANWTKITGAYTKVTMAIEATYGTIKGVLTGKIKLATLAQQGWNLALKANPIGLIVGLIAGAVAWLISFEQRTGKVSAALKKAGDWVIDLANSFIDLYNSSLPVRVAVNYIVASFKTGFAAAKLALMQFLEPVKLAGKLIKAALTFDVQGIKDAFTDFAKNSKNNVVKAAESVADTWSTAYQNAMSGKIEHIQKKQTVTVSTEVVDEESSGGPLEPVSNYSGKSSGGTLDDMADEDEEGEESDISGGGKTGKTKSKKGSVESLKEDSVQRLEILQNELDTKKAVLAEMGNEDEKYALKNIDAGEKIRENIENNIEAYQAELDARQEIGNAIMDIADQAFNTLIEIAGKETTVGKALFLLNQARAVGEVIFNTGIANAKAVAASPLTFGQPWVGINTASAAVSIASIIAQSVASLKSDGGSGGSGRNSSKIGAAHFSEGGYTGDGAANEPAGIVHRGEYVLPADAVHNPSLRPLIDGIEVNRRNNRLASLNMRDLMQAAAYRGYAAGGYVQSQTNVPSVPNVTIAAPVDEDLKALLKANMEMMAALRDKKLVVYTELIKKDLDTLDHINKNRNL